LTKKNIESDTQISKGAAVQRISPQILVKGTPVKGEPF
jgi:hypothetical protein